VNDNGDDAQSIETPGDLPDVEELALVLTLFAHTVIITMRSKIVLKIFQPFCSIGTPKTERKDTQ